ncbi:hypothetical protein ACLOJK_019293 [Asimina triloba]
MKEDTTGLLSNLAAARAEQDEAVNGAEAAKEKALELSTELTTSRSEAKALRAHGADPDINGVESRVELEVARGEVSLLHRQVAHLGSREVELLSKSEVAQAEVARLWVELEASQAKVACLRETSSHGGDTPSLSSLLANVGYVPYVDVVPRHWYDD